MEESFGFTRKVLVPSHVGEWKDGSVVEAVSLGSIEQFDAVWIGIKKMVVNNYDALKRSLVGRFFFWG